jgi:hypothetical protein
MSQTETDKKPKPWEHTKIPESKGPEVKPWRNKQGDEADFLILKISEAEDESAGVARLAEDTWNITKSNYRKEGRKLYQK